LFVGCFIKWGGFIKSNIASGIILQPQLGSGVGTPDLVGKTKRVLSDRLDLTKEFF